MSANSVTLGDLLLELPEVSRNSTTGALDNQKRTRGINRILQDLQMEADWDVFQRTLDFKYIAGVNEYSLENYIGCVCLDNDGETEILDFKAPRYLTLKSNNRRQWLYREAEEVRQDIVRGAGKYKYSTERDLMLISYYNLPSVLIHDCDSLTALGTVTASDDAENLTLDEIVFQKGTGSFNFDVTTGQKLTITIELTTPLDLTDFKNKGALTAYIDLPTITNFTNVIARWGSNSDKYNQKIETTPASKAELKTGRNLFAFDWAEATETGTAPDVTAIDWIQFEINYSANITDTDFRIDEIRMAATEDMTLEYFSHATVETEGGSYQLEFNADDVTQSDKLLGGVKLRRTVMKGAEMEAFHMIGGKSERDLRNARQDYVSLRTQSIKQYGHRVRRKGKQLDFAGGGRHVGKIF